MHIKKSLRRPPRQTIVHVKTRKDIILMLLKEILIDLLLIYGLVSLIITIMDTSSGKNVETMTTDSKVESTLNIIKFPPKKKDKEIVDKEIVDKEMGVYIGGVKIGDTAEITLSDMPISQSSSTKTKNDSNVATRLLSSKEEKKIIREKINKLKKDNSIKSYVYILSLNRNPTSLFTVKYKASYSIKVLASTNITTKNLERAKLAIILQNEHGIVSEHRFARNLLYVEFQNFTLNIEHKLSLSYSAADKVDQIISVKTKYDISITKHCSCGCPKLNC